MFLNLQMGTCYTAEECEDNSGTASGSCADGYGVCCICKCSRQKSAASASNRIYLNGK